MSFTDIKKELKQLDKEKLIDLIADLYKKNKSVREFFDFYVKPDEKELFKKYKDKVEQAFFPKRGDRFSLKDGKQAISDFKKLGVSSDYLADLMLFYVETGVIFTNTYGDINEAFYTSLAKTYLQALTLMRSENILEKFTERAFKVVLDTGDIGWGFHDYLGDVHANFYLSNTDEED